MAGRRKAPLWRQAFLRALKRTGNVRTSAFEAGVDPGTAYDHRAKDDLFRARWGQAVAAFKLLPSPRPSPRGGRGSRDGEELVLRRTKHGDKWVRAAPGRWCARVEESFLDGLERTGCVETAAAAAGLSTNAFYARREAYPEFRARWDERAARAGAQLPGLLNAAAVASLRPVEEGAKRRGRARLPAVNIDQAIRIRAINQNAEAKAGGPRRRGGELHRQPELTKEELVQKLMVLFDMLGRRQSGARLAEGWTDAGNGIWVPPGWTPPAGWEKGDGAGPPSP